MLRLEELKQNILDNKYNNFYIFTGNEYGIKEHYINKIAEQFDNKKTKYESYTELINRIATINLLKRKELFIIYNDETFLQEKEDTIKTLITRLGKIYTAIFLYDDLLKDTILSKKFNEYITEFNHVEDNVGIEFVESEITLLQDSKEELAYNCENDYSNILNETDKIKTYSKAKSTSMENAYNSLKVSNQLIYRYQDYNCNMFMNDILQGNYKNLAIWEPIIKKQIDSFYNTILFILNDYLIAYYIKKYGKYKGGTTAYNLGLNWNRIKTIREFNLQKSPAEMLESAYKITDIDLKVKNGTMEMKDIFDYFVTNIVYL